MIMSVALDGRNEEGTDDPTLKFFPIAIKDDFTEAQKYKLIGGARSGKNESDGAQYFNHQKLLRFMHSLRYGKQNVKYIIKL